MLNYEKGNEYYAIQQYAKDHLNNEIYATDQNGNNFYLNIGTQDEINEIFAITGESKIYYAKNKVGDFILPIQNKKPYYYFHDKKPTFPTNNENLQVYGKLNGCEIYPNNGTTDIYLKDRDGNECYAKNVKGQYYYASKIQNDELIQFYAKDKNGKNIFINDENGDLLYLINISLNRPIYNNIQEKEVYIKINNKEFYGRTLNKLPIYAKNKDQEYLALDENQKPYYANYKEIEFYPKLHNKKQFYRKIQNKEIYANKSKNEEYYAKTQDLNDQLARNENNVTYYCKKLNIEKYPKTNKNDEFYKLENNIEVPALKDKKLEYYAKKSDGTLFYPKDFSIQALTSDHDN